MKNKNKTKNKTKQKLTKHKNKLDVKNVKRRNQDMGWELDEIGFQ